MSYSYSYQENVADFCFNWNVAVRLDTIEGLYQEYFR